MVPKAIILAKHLNNMFPAKRNLKTFMRIVLPPDNIRVRKIV